MIWDTAPGFSRCSLCPHFFTPCHSNPSPAPFHVPSLFVFIKVLSVAFLSSHTPQLNLQLQISPSVSTDSSILKAISNMLWKSRTKTDPPYCAQVSKQSAPLRSLLSKLFISARCLRQGMGNDTKLYVVLFFFF